MLRLLRATIAIALWVIALLVSVMGYNPLEAAFYATIGVFVHPSTSRLLVRKARELAGVQEGPQRINREIDRQTRQILEYLERRRPEYLRQVSWGQNPVVRFIDLVTLGTIGRFLLERGRRASGSRAIELLSKAVTATSSRTVMAKALFYRGTSVFDGATSADTAIADYSLALSCDPTDCWVRKSRANVYEMYRHMYGKGDEMFALPMTDAGAIADSEAVVGFFRSLAESHPLAEGRRQASTLLGQSEEVLAKLKGQSPETRARR